MLAIITVAFLLSSCASTSTKNYKSVGKAPLPEPETKLVLTFTNEDIIVLGDIDITKEMKWSYTDMQTSSQKDSVNNYGFFYNSYYMPVTKTSFFKSAMSNEDQLISSIIYDAISQYPDMDYILFPKTEKTISESYGTSDKPNSIKIRLRGKAIKIDLTKK